MNWLLSSIVATGIALTALASEKNETSWTVWEWKQEQERIVFTQTQRAIQDEIQRLIKPNPDALVLWLRAADDILIMIHLKSWKKQLTLENTLYLNWKIYDCEIVDQGADGTVDFVVHTESDDESDDLGDNEKKITRIPNFTEQAGLETILRGVLKIQDPSSVFLKVYTPK